MADPIGVDPTRYSVEFENDRVRILRIRYGPGEKSVMHSHPAGVVVFVTDCNARMAFPDGSTEALTAAAGETAWTDPTEHEPENLSDKPMEVIQIELKD